MNQAAEPQKTALINDDPGVELASNRTSLSFERTRMGADRTLMAIVRTSLSLIGFGFTIYTVFQKLAQSKVLPLNQDSPRNFGLALIVIGIAMLVMGIWSHLRFQRALTDRRQQLFDLHLLRHSVEYRATPTLAAAAALLLVGLAAFAVIIFNSVG